MEHQFFIRQQNLKLYRSLVAASEAAAAKADARQQKLLKLLAEEVANEPPPGKNRRRVVTKLVLGVNRSAVCGFGGSAFAAYDVDHVVLA